MARHGENIRKRKDGRWEGRYLVYSEEKGKKIYRSVYGGTYEVAKEKLTIKKSSLTEGKKVRRAWRQKAVIPRASLPRNPLSLRKWQKNGLTR